MLFNPEALHNKTLFLDAIFQKPGLIEKVISRHLNEPFKCFPIPRSWEPGGGATLFRIESRQGLFLLKVKHQSVHVESRLECEPFYSFKPSLQNEYDFLNLLSSELVAKTVFFDEEESFQFLALEWLIPFHIITQTMTANQLLDVWQRIVDTVKMLYSFDIVHTDIHEHNICFRDSIPILIDFEEARFLNQDVVFEDSLDVIGVNKFGSVGEFPSVMGSIGGQTCLQRLRLVFKSLIWKQLPELINNANFDDSCPYNLDDLQQPDSRVYQSLSFPGFSIEGQRPKQDLRQLFFGYLLCKSALKEGLVTHIDLGSNIGAFCFQAVQYPFVNSSLGLEAFQQYVDVSKILAFLYDFSGAKFTTFVCGEDGMGDKLLGANFITMFSVYHHITRKDDLLWELKKIGARYLLTEFATQDRYYSQRGGLPNELNYIQQVTGYKNRYLLDLSRDYQRPIILFSNENLTFFDRVFIRIANFRLNSIGWFVFYIIRLVTIIRVRFRQYE